jgi:hypothetical protein
MSRIIIALSLLIVMVTATSLPTPPLIHKYEGECGPGRLSCQFVLPVTELPSGYTVFITSLANRAHELTIEQSSPTLKSTSYVLVSASSIAFSFSLSHFLLLHPFLSIIYNGLRLDGCVEQCITI